MKTKKANKNVVAKKEWTVKHNTKWAIIGTLITLSAFLFIIMMMGIVYSAQGYWDENGKTNFIEDANGDLKWSNIPASYHGLFWTLLLLSVAGLFVVGSWARGDKWINKSNPYVAGVKYIRTKEQDVVFRFTVMFAATLSLYSFIMDATFGGFFGNLKRAGDGKDLMKTQFPKIFTEWIFRPQNWYYQCYLTSLFLAIAIFKRRYDWMFVLLPLGFLGSIRTFADIEDWGDNAYWSSIYFHRFMIIHLILWIVPLFVIFANRQTVSLIIFKRTLIYTFFMMFFAYAIISTTQIIDEPGAAFKPALANKAAGEISGTGLLLGKEMDWIQSNFQTYFWLMVVPFGIAIITGFYLIINLAQFKPWMRDLKTKDFEEFKKSFYTSFRIYNAFTKEQKLKVEKIKYTPFGQ